MVAIALSFVALMLVLLATPMPWPVDLAAALLGALVLLPSLRRQSASAAPGPALVVDASGAVYLVNHAAAPVPLRGLHVSRHLVVLADPDGARTVLWSDSLAPAAFRRLVVALRWRRPPAEPIDSTAGSTHGAN